VHAFGTTIRLQAQIRDLDGELAEASSVQLTILLPDGTQSTPEAGVADGVGLYHVDYTPAQDGRHVARWVATSPDVAFEEPFDVAASWGGAGIVSLAAAKRHLNIPATNTDVDEELTGFVQATTEIVERFTGAVARRPVIDVLDGGGEAVALSCPPVLSVTSVTESGATVTQSGWLLDATAGVLRRRLGEYASTWEPGAGNITVSYTAGRRAVGENINRAALVIIAHLWETQRNTSGRRPQLGETQAEGRGTYYSIPNRAIELLGEPVLGIA
jgi:hypothetical protein